VSTPIAIVIDDKGNPPRFRLAQGDSAPRITSAVVVDMSTEKPIWWLVPASFTAVHSFTSADVSAADVEALADAEPLDPIEDLPPPDPRHRAAIAQRDALETASPLLGSLTYGVVPLGFRQASPETGLVALVPGRSYGLTVMGPGGHGGIQFQVHDHGPERRPTSA
jgi:hypothetical protein